MPLEASANSQDLITVSDIRHNTLILKNGGLVQVLMVAGTNFALKPEDEQNILTAAYQNFLNSLGFSLQIIIHSRKVNIQRYLATLQKREAEEISPLLQNQIAEYREFIASFVKENPIMTKTFFVAVPYHPTSLTKKPRGSLKNLLPWPGKKKPEAEETEALNKETEAELEKNLLQLRQRVLHVTQGLAAVGLLAKPLTNEELIELLYNFYNPEAIEKEDLRLPAA